MPDAERDFLVAYLADRDVACPKCSYSLRGLLDRTCPECGQLLEVRVAATEPAMGAWIFGLIGLSSGFGFCALTMMYFAVYIIRIGMPFMDLPPISLGVGCVVNGLLLMSWVRRRRAVWKNPERLRHACLLSILAMIWPVLFFLVV